MNEHVDKLIKTLKYHKVSNDVIHKARDFFSRQPFNPDLWIGLATALREEGKYEVAIKIYDIAIDCFPDSFNHVFWANRGLVYLTMKQFDKALQSLHKSLNIKPDYSFALFQTGRTFEGISDYQNASVYYKKAIEISPNDKKAWNNLGLSQYQLKEVTEAINCYRTAIDLDPNYCDAIFNLACLFFNENEYNEAQKLFVKLLEINPGDEQARKLLNAINDYQGIKNTLVSNAFAKEEPFDDCFNWIDDESFYAKCNKLKNNPKSVFISYGWDNEQHKARVLSLADDLVSHGFEVILDQFENVNIAQLISLGMCCRNVILIASKRYSSATLLQNEENNLRSMLEFTSAGIDGTSSFQFKDGWSTDENQTILLNIGKFDRLVTLYFNGRDCFCIFPIIDFSRPSEYGESIQLLIAYLNSNECKNLPQYEKAMIY